MRTATAVSMTPDDKKRFRRYDHCRNIDSIKTRTTAAFGQMSVKRSKVFVNSRRSTTFLKGEQLNIPSHSVSHATYLSLSPTFTARKRYNRLREIANPLSTKNR